VGDCIKNSELNWGFTWFVTVMDFWLMPLLFLLAGMLNWYVIERINHREYFREKFIRLFVPFIAGMLLIVPPQAYIASISAPDQKLGYFKFLKNYVTNLGDLTGYFGSFTPAHLWFVLYLFIIYLLAFPGMLTIKKSMKKPLFKKIAKYMSSPWIFILLFIPMTCIEAIPSPGGKNPIYYLFIFLLGFFICCDSSFQKTINRIKLDIFIFLAVFIPIWCVVIFFNRGAEPWSAAAVAIAFMKNLAVLLALLMVIAYGKKYLSFENKLLHYLKEATLPIYILHQTVMIVVAFFVVNLNIEILFKFIAINIVSLVICFCIYEFVIRKFIFTRWLFGMKLSPAKYKDKVTDYNSTVG